jgi:hypothetical protein
MRGIKIFNHFNLRKHHSIICQDFNRVAISANRIFLSQTRFISENSWAAELLKKSGEILEKSSPLPQVEITDELIDNPPDHVKALVKEFIGLNYLEAAQLRKYVQVQ